MSPSKDPYFTIESVAARLDSLHEDILEMKSDLKEIKASQDKDITTLKLESEKCKTHWSLVSMIISLGGLGAVVSALINAVLGNNPHK